MFRAVVYSDIHIGTFGTPSEFIFDNLKWHIQKYKSYINKSDAIILSGDISHKLLSLGSRDSYYYIQTILLFGNICKNNNMELIILEGTSSHDMGQFKQVEELLKDRGINYRYVDKICMQKVKDLNVLFIPDNHSLSGNKVIEKVDNILFENKLSKFDLAITHNGYKYQLPVKLKSLIDEDILSRYVDGYIVSGHIHTPSEYKNIIVPGSFDRLAHGEEEDKGALYFEIDLNTNYRHFERLINEKAMIYKTLEVINTDTIEKEIMKYPKGSHIALKTDMPINKNVIDRLSQYYIIDIKTTKKEKVKYDLDRDTNIDTIDITPNNIIELLENELGYLSSEEYKIFKEEIKEVI